MHKGDVLAKENGRISLGGQYLLFCANIILLICQWKSKSYTMSLSAFLYRKITDWPDKRIMKCCVARGLCNASQHRVQYFHLIEVIAEKEASESIMRAEGCTDATVPCHLPNSFSGQCFHSMCSWVKASYIGRSYNRLAFQLLWRTALKGRKLTRPGGLFWINMRTYHVQSYFSG